MPDEASGLDGSDFWQLAGGVQPYVAYEPRDAEDLASRSDVATIAKIVDVEPYAGSDLSVMLVLQTQAGLILRTRYTLPFQIVNDFDTRQIRSILPEENAFWFLERAEYDTPVPDIYSCTQFYYCAFVQRDSGVVTAIAPGAILPGINDLQNIDDLAKYSR